MLLQGSPGSQGNKNKLFAFHLWFCGCSCILPLLARTTVLLAPCATLRESRPDKGMTLSSGKLWCRSRFFFGQSFSCASSCEISPCPWPHTDPVEGGLSPSRDGQHLPGVENMDRDGGLQTSPAPNGWQSRHRCPAHTELAEQGWQGDKVGPGQCPVM